MSYVRAPRGLERSLCRCIFEHHSRSETPGPFQVSLLAAG